jgi:hypothetical protein
MSLKVKYSLNSEKKLVNKLFKNYYFFKKGYLFRFPMNLDARLAPKNEIIRALPKEYNSSEYKLFAHNMVKKYSKIGNVLNQN